MFQIVEYLPTETLRSIPITAPLIKNNKHYFPTHYSYWEVNSYRHKKCTECKQLPTHINLHGLRLEENRSSNLPCLGSASPQTSTPTTDIGQQSDLN
jgi:hypothetical protein